jgi:hypothetical protein
MKHLLSYQLFENQPESKIEALDFLFKNGLIDPPEYIREIKFLLDEGEIQSSDLSDEIIPIVNIEDRENLGESEKNWFKDWFKDWRGPGGVRIVLAEGTYGETWFDLQLTLSNGDHITADWNGYHGSWNSFYLDRPGVVGHIRIRDEETLMEELDEKYDAETNTPFFNDWLDALVKSA